MFRYRIGEGEIKVPRIGHVTADKCRVARVGRDAAADGQCTLRVRSTLLARGFHEALTRVLYRYS